MEQNNYRDEFEQFLRDCTDDFIMIPARKVWYGIYNDTHPAKRWPSMAIALLMLFSILFVGVSNNNNINHSAQNKETVFAANLPTNKAVDEKDVKESQFANNNEVQNLLPANKNLNGNSNLLLSKKNKQSTLAISNTTSANTTASLVNATNKIIDNFSYVNANSKNIQQQPSKSKITKATQVKPVTTNDEVENLVITNSDESINVKTINKLQKSKNIVVVNAEKENTTVLNVAEENEDKKNGTENNETIIAKNTTEEKAWKENYALQNRPKLQLPKPSKTITYYVTPSFGFRTFGNNTTSKLIANNTSSSLFANRTFVDEKEIQNDNAALNIEVGAAVKIPITKKLLFKAGVQFNYTNYVTSATSIGHSTEAIMATNNSKDYIRASYYTTEKGKDKLNNTTLQLSIPLGVDVKLLSISKVNWYFGAALQPSYTFGGSAFLLSENGKNYISDYSMLRKWNINTAIETFITYKPSSEVTLQFGPQIRYQLFSTYKQPYSYRENLYNFGLKLGITRSF